MMKFSVSLTTSSSNAARHGVLSEIKSSSDTVLKTPLCLVYTKCGAVPHLTHEVLKRVAPHEFSYLLPLPSMSHEALSNYKQGIGQFVGIQKGLLYVCNQDATEYRPRGYNEKDTISVWTRHGRSKIDKTKFMSAIEAISPDWYQAMSDTDVSQDSSSKRLHMSINRTLDYLDTCLENHLKSTMLREKEIFGTVVGGFKEDLRELSAKLTAKRPVAGFLIDGLITSSVAQKTKFEDIKSLLLASINQLPTEKPRILHGPLRPDFIIDAIDNGVDIFDSSYAHVVTERNSALCFDDLSNDRESMSNNNEESNNSSIPGEINLLDKRYTEDFNPLVDHCKCYSCRTFTRAYIHHLLNINELLGPVALAMHNLEYFLKFFENIQISMKEGTFAAYSRKIKNIYQVSLES